MTLLPCPFCGETRVGRISQLRDGCEVGEPDAWCANVRCPCCAAEGPWAKADDEDNAKRRAANEWNRRATP
jgi:hypothetical protein